MRIRAIYNKHPVRHFCGNPLTEALSIFPNMSVLLKKVEKTLDVTDFWELDLIYQQAILQEFANIHIPAPQFDALYSKFMALLLYSYSQVHPFSADNQKNKYKMALLMGDPEAKWDHNIQMSGTTTAPSVVVQGPSGVGKTTEIRCALASIPQVIEHHKYEGREYRQDQLVWISIDLPSTPSLKALALNFFLAVDTALGITNYYKEWSKKWRNSVDSHLIGMQQVALVHELGLMHIDELQFMLKYAKSDKSPSLQILEALFNKLGIPLVLSCTTQGLALFDSLHTEKTLTPDITTIRRMLNDREFKFDVYKAKSSHFKNLFHAFFPDFLQWPGDSLDENFYLKFHFLTCGLPAVMSRLAHLYHETHIQLRDKGKAVLPNNLELLEVVYKHQFKLIDPALILLRRNLTTQYEAALIKGSASKAVLSDTDKHKQNKEKSIAVAEVSKGGMFDEHISAPSSVTTHIANGFSKGDY
jgi:hypothetical protein